MELMIEAKNIVKTFKGQALPVLKGVSLDIRAGDTLSIVGPSGAGKSTLLSILGSLEAPTQGQVLFEGKDITRFSEKEKNIFRNSKIGFVFQFHHLLTDFNAQENVAMPLLIGGVDRGEALGRADKILDRVGLSNRLKHLPSELSGGEQQRVALARALVGKPSCLLADEPTGNLDATQGTKIFDLLLELNEELKTTLIVVTHNEVLARRFSRMIQLVNGQIKSTT